jgi:hypothetical protein
MSLRQLDFERAEEALSLAAITYGEFLERCEPVDSKNAENSES